MDSIVRNIYISNNDFMGINSQSCDCSAIIVDYGNKLEIYEHMEHIEDGAISATCIDSFDKLLFSHQVELDNEFFMLDKKLFKEDGFLDAVRFKFKDVYLFIFASEYNLILTKSKCDIFEDQPIVFPETEAVLSIKQLE